MFFDARIGDDMMDLETKSTGLNAIAKAAGEGVSFKRAQADRGPFDAVRVMAIFAHL